MRIRVDRTKCEGHGLCADIAPAVFEIGDDDLSRVVDDDPDERARSDARVAAASCPTLAIGIADDPAD